MKIYPCRIPPKYFIYAWKWTFNESNSAIRTEIKIDGGTVDRVTKHTERHTDKVSHTEAQLLIIRFNYGIKKDQDGIVIKGQIDPHRPRKV